MYIEVYVSYPLDQSFTYAVPAGVTPVAGQRARINFAGRKTIAPIVDVHDQKPKGYNVKELIEIVDETPLFGGAFIDLCRFVAGSYLAAPGEVMAMALPSGERPSDRFKVPFGEEVYHEKVLTPEQEEVACAIEKGFSEGENRHYIHGVTGSGKTEVYIELAGKMMGRGKSVIFLVPEISLSSQIYERLYRVFGDELILYHSQLTKNQRLYNWQRFYSGEARVAIGTRSSVFLQCPDLGMIVVDEEHDGSYKENSTPRYNARRVALYRCNAEKALLLMGSATPSIESYYTAREGTFQLHKLTQRFGGASLPEIKIVSAKSERGRESITSQLKLYVHRAMEKNEQSILLLNRRGFSPFVLCNGCGEIITCPHCSISMNYHRGDQLLCHYCGYHRPMPAVCPSCGVEDLAKVGTGTQKVEDELAGIFPAARLFRLDQDTARKKKSVYELVDRMKKGEIDILLGTQMVSKGFDFNRVSVIGILLADLGLNIPDFRASERVYSLLTQVAGRSGRGGTGGTVVLQALDVEHPLFDMVLRQDYEGFYNSEIEFRRALNYPPFCRLVRLLVRGSDQKAVASAADRLASALRSVISGGKFSVSLLGPAAAPLERIGGNFRHHIILKGKDIRELRRAVRSVKDTVKAQGLYLEIDIDPVDLL